MPVLVHADQIAQPDACADQRHKTPRIYAVLQLDIVRRPAGECGALADECPRLIGDLSAAHSLPEKPVREGRRQEVRSDMERIVQHQQGAPQQHPCVQRQLLQIVLQKELRQQRVYPVSPLLFHSCFSLLILCYEHKTLFLYCTPVPLFFQEKRIDYKHKSDKN